MKRRRIILIITIVLSCLAIGLTLKDYYTPPAERVAYMISHHNDDTIRIAYIGDSWAAMHKEHECTIAKKIEDSIHRPVIVSSCGIHGKTSKEIYENLFDNKDIHDFMMKGYDFCFISAGINDTYKKMSVKYYKKSIENIIRFMLINHIHPIILDIPDYNIVKAYDNQKMFHKLLRKASTLITGSQVDCKQEFRNTLYELVNNKNYEISILKYQEWNKDYLNDLNTYYLND